MTKEEFIVALLAVGLVPAFFTLRWLRRRAHQGGKIHGGMFGICCSLAGALPGVLIKLRVIRQTEYTVLLVFAYFFLFVIGAMLVFSNIADREHSEGRD